MKTTIISVIIVVIITTHPAMNVKISGIPKRVIVFSIIPEPIVNAIIIPTIYIKISKRILSFIHYFYLIFFVFCSKVKKYHCGYECY